MIGSNLLQNHSLMRRRRTSVHATGLAGLLGSILVAALFSSCAQESRPNPQDQIPGTPSSTLEPISQNPRTDSLITAHKKQNANGDSTYSNIRRSDYVGPETCAKCHKKNYQNWQKHPTAA
jgi:hypothetical protein